MGDLHKEVATVMVQVCPLGVRWVSVGFPLHARECARACARVRMVDRKLPTPALPLTLTFQLGCGVG